MKITIGCFTDLRNGGGGGTHAKAVADGLAERGYTGIKLLSKAANSCVPGTGKYNGIDVEYFHISNGLFWRVPSLRRGKLLEDVFRRHEKPEAILCISPYMVNAARAVWPDVRIIYLFPCLLYRCMPFTVGLQGRRNVWFKAEHYLMGRVEAAALDNCDRVIFQSPVVLADAKDFHDFPQEKAMVSPYGSIYQGQIPAVPRDQMREQLSTPQGATVLVAGGNFDYNKNFEHIIEELALSETNLWLWLVGDGPNRSGLVELAKRLRVDQRVKFLGWQDDVVSVYSAADAVVHAAYYDAFPLVCLEAMACGLPVVGPANNWPRVISSMEYIINDGIEGWTYDLEQKGSLAEIFNVISDDVELVHQMGYDALKRVRDDLPWSRYVDVVQEILK